MAIKDPVALCNVATSEEAKGICQILGREGIEATVTEDATTSPNGEATGGDRPRVIVDKESLQLATEFLHGFAQAQTLFRSRAGNEASAQAFVTCICEECGQSSTFTSTVMGSVQECPHCGKFMDVGAAGDDLDWGEPEADELSEVDDQ